MSAHAAHDRWATAGPLPQQPLGGSGHDGRSPSAGSAHHDDSLRNDDSVRNDDSAHHDDSVRTVLVCDDRSEVRDAITAILADLPRYRVIGEAQDCASCRDSIERMRPDLLILDVSIPGGGAEAARTAKDIHPDVQIVVFSGRQDRRTQREMMAAGADHYVVKTGRLGPLVESLDRAFFASLQRSRQLR